MPNIYTVDAESIRHAIAQGTMDESEEKDAREHLGYILDAAHQEEARLFLRLV